MIVPGILVCNNFLISVCMMSKVLLVSSATVIVRAGGAIWLNPFASVLFTVCSAVTVECCVAWVCLVYFLLCKKEGCSQVSMTDRRDVGLYEVTLSMSLLVFGMETMLVNFHMCGIILVLRAGK